MGKLPEDDQIHLDMVTASQAFLDIRELQDLGLVWFHWEMDLEGLRYIVGRGAQLGMIPTRGQVEGCVGFLVKEMGCDDKTARDTKRLVEFIDEARDSFGGRVKP